MMAQVGMQGVVSPARLQAASAKGTALVYVANALGGGGWAKAMALSIALSVIATTGTGIVLSARIVYGMASYRVLPEFLSNSVFLAEDVFFSIFFPTQPAPLEGGVIPAVLAVKGLR